MKLVAKESAKSEAVKEVIKSLTAQVLALKLSYIFLLNGLCVHS